MLVFVQIEGPLFGSAVSLHPGVPNGGAILVLIRDHITDQVSVDSSLLLLYLLRSSLREDLVAKHVLLV